MASELDLRQLKQVIDDIFDHMHNDLGIEKVSIADEQDFYWDVPSNKIRDVKADQPQLDVGRLTDDWEFLAPILKDKNQALAIMLIHVAPLLRRIGEDVGQ
jgi:hypothetical protein